ncbi:MAG: Mur ligase family protein [Bdellovibrionota bacterium]|nr:Mur ligase family protein [Bdellovibrionota bacterium]
MNLENYLNYENIKKNKSTIKRIFFYRICGTGMGSSACLLKSAGYEVSGADKMFYPPMSTYLEESKIEVHRLDDFELESLKGEVDLIVVGNVVSGKSDEAREIEKLGIPFCSFPAAIGALILDQKKVIGLAGTHGKTTTTYLGIQVFENLKLNPSYLVGAVLDDMPSALMTDSEYFFIESDEYDSAYFEKFSKFRSYSVDHLVLTSLEFDHADIFETLEDIKDEFRAIIPNVKQNIVCSDWDSIIDIYDHMGENVDFYGEKNVLIKEANKNGTSFEVTFNNSKYDFHTNLIGKHNILNLSAILIFALSEGIKKEELNEAIKNLKLAKRRQEEVGFYNGAVIIDDFTHHPTAVEETIAAIKIKYPDKKINVFLEPGSATARSDIFQDRFISSLREAFKVWIINPSKKTTAIGHGDLDFNQLVKNLKSDSSKEAYLITELDELIDEIKDNSNDQSLNLVMSNSTCLGLWSSDFVKSL